MMKILTIFAALTLVGMTGAMQTKMVPTVSLPKTTRARPIPFSTRASTDIMRCLFSTTGATDTCNWADSGSKSGRNNKSKRAGTFPALFYRYLKRAAEKNQGDRPVPATRHHSALQKESLPADDSDSFSFGVEVFTLPHTVPVTL